MTNFTGIAGRLNRYIGTAAADAFRFAAADLDGDTLSGLGGVDLLHITTAGALGANALANVSGIETIALAPGGNAITLLDANYTGVTGARITVFGNSGDDTIDASGLTGSRAVDFRSGGGLDVLRGGAGADVFRFFAADLDGDTLSGGLGTDQLAMRSAGVLGAGALANMSGIETITLAAGTNSITLLDGNLAGVASGRLSVFGASGNDTIDASGLTGSNAVLINSLGGLDVLKGGAGNDTFRFIAAELAGDTVEGGAGTDTLQFSAPGALAADALANVRGVEAFGLTAGTNSITLVNGNFTDVTGGRITVYGSSGVDTIDASGLSAANSVLFFGLGSVDVLRGGAGADEFRFSVGNLAGDTVLGGGGSDLLKITSAGTLGTAELANVSGIETIQLADGTNSLTLVAANFTAVTGFRIAVLGGAGDDRIDAGTTPFQALDITAGAGLDALYGGGGNDTFRFAAADLDGDTVSGGGGSNTLEFTAAGEVTALELANVTRIRTVTLASGTNSITLVDSMFSGVNGGLTFNGAGGDDTIDASGLTVSNFISFRSGAGLDVLKGGVANDVFNFAAADLAGDTIVGGAGTDRLNLASAGVLAADALANMSGVESISLFPSGNGITLTDANFTGVAGGLITITGSSNADTVDGSGLTGSNAIDVTTGGSVDTFRGGAGADTFRFFVIAAAGNTIAGGAGNDRLIFNGASAAVVDALANMTGIETLELSAGNFGQTFTVLTDANFAGVAGGKITVLGSGGADTVDGSALTSANALDITANAGDDILRGGAGDDIFRFAAVNLGIDTVNGGSGMDTLRMTSAADSQLGLAIRNLSAVETIELASGTNYFTVSDINFAGVTGGKITIFGNSGNDEITGAGLTGSNALVITAGGGRDNLSGGEADDEFRFAAADMTGDGANGRGGSDTLRLTTAGTLGVNDLTNVTAVETIVLADGTNSITVLDRMLNNVVGSVLTVIGGSGADTISGAGLTGIKAMSITAGAGDDGLTGGAGADTFTGGTGADTMNGGAGADRFVWNSKTEGGDTITDFTSLQDKLVFSAADFGIAGSAFDRIVDENIPNFTSLNTIDMLTFDAYAIDSGAEFRAMIAANYPSTSHGMFALVFNSNNDVVLYYTSDASLAASDDPAGDYHQIANLGQLPGGLSLDVSDFVFI